MDVSWYFHCLVLLLQVLYECMELTQVWNQWATICRGMLVRSTSCRELVRGTFTACLHLFWVLFFFRVVFWDFFRCLDTNTNWWIVNRYYCNKWIIAFYVLNFAEDSLNFAVGFTFAVSQSPSVCCNQVVSFLRLFVDPTSKRMVLSSYLPGEMGPVGRCTWAYEFRRRRTRFLAGARLLQRFSWGLDAWELCWDLDYLE